MIVDFHRHMLPPNARDWLDSEGAAVGVELEGGEVVHTQGFRWPLSDRFTEAEAVMADLASQTVDAAVVSIPPPLLFHEAPTDAAAEFVDEANRGLLALAQAHPGRFRVLGSVLLQDPRAAAEGVHRLAANQLCAGVQIGTSLHGCDLSDPAFGDFWRAVAESRLLAMIHPVYLGGLPGLEDRYLTNVAGNPLLTTVAAMRMIDAGLLESESAPTVLLVHAGGFLPYQLGRLAHASKVRSELRVSCADAKDAAYSFLYDTITHDPQVLRFLIEHVGASRVLLGSDAPFDMADPDPVGTLASASGTVVEQVASWNAVRVLGARGFADAPARSAVSAEHEDDHAS